MWSELKKSYFMWIEMKLNQQQLKDFFLKLNCTFMTFGTKGLTNSRTNKYFTIIYNKEKISTSIGINKYSNTKLHKAIHAYKHMH